MLDDAIEVYDRHGCVELLCGKTAFARLRDLLVTEAKLAESALPKHGTIIIIEFGNMPEQPRARFRERIALLGCGLVVVLL